MCGSSAWAEFARPIYSRDHVMLIKIGICSFHWHHIASVFVTALDSKIKHSRKDDLVYIQNILHIACFYGEKAKKKKPSTSTVLLKN